MLKHRLHETLTLVRRLMLLAVPKGGVPDPEKYMSEILAIDLAKMRKANLRDERDVFRDWYGEHIKWPLECLCEREEVELGRMLGLLSPKVGGLQRIWRTHPWFLSACVQVARRSLREDGFHHLELYTSQGKHEIGQPISKGETLWITASVRMEAYLTSSEWRIDDAPLEDLKYFGQVFNVERKSDEDRRDYFNRVKDQLDDRLIRAMRKATEIALHPRVKLRGDKIHAENRHEEMLVLRMFGALIPNIVEATKDALVDKQGRPLEDRKRAVYERTKTIATYLDFRSPTAKKSFK